MNFSVRVISFHLITLIIQLCSGAGIGFHVIGLCLLIAIYQQKKTTKKLLYI